MGCNVVELGYMIPRRDILELDDILAKDRLRQRRDYFIERHRVEPLALLFGELPRHGRTPAKELVAKSNAVSASRSSSSCDR